MSVPLKAMRDVFIEALHGEMKKRDDIVFLSADFGSPKLDALREEFPERFYNVGIAEQNLINISAGMAIEGWNVFAYAIAPFITMRCYEQIRVNLALLSKEREMNVTLIGVGAGVSYDVSGPTHHCLEDLAIMRLLPGMEVYSPSDYVTAQKLVPFCLQERKLRYLRFDSKPLPAIYSGPDPDLEQGFERLKKGKKLLIIATGYMVHRALEFNSRFDVGVIDLYGLVNVNGKKLADCVSGYDHVMTLEEGFINRGGLDTLVKNIIHNEGLSVSVTPVGINNEYSFAIGSRDAIHSAYGFGTKDVSGLIIKLLEVSGVTA